MWSNSTGVNSENILPASATWPTGMASQAAREAAPHRLDARIGVSLCDGGGRGPLEDFDNGAIGGVHDDRRAIRGETFGAQQRVMIADLGEQHICLARLWPISGDNDPGNGFGHGAALRSLCGHARHSLDRNQLPWRPLRAGNCGSEDRLAAAKAGLFLSRGAAGSGRGPDGACTGSGVSDPTMPSGRALASIA